MSDQVNFKVVKEVWRVERLQDLKSLALRTRLQITSVWKKFGIDLSYFQPL